MPRRRSTSCSVTSRLGMLTRVLPLTALALALLFGCGDGSGPSDGAELHGESGPADLSAAAESPQEKVPPLVPGSVAWTPDLAHAALKRLNPGYNGRALFQFEGDQITGAQLTDTGVTDLTPLQGMMLRGLDLRGTAVTDIGPLRGLPLTELYLEGTAVSDLGPLRDTKLRSLYLSGTPVEDLSPLRGLPLTELNLLGTNVEDLTPLRGLPLEFLWLNETPVSDISALTHCPLVSLTLHRTLVTDLMPLIGTDLQRLHVGETRVTDLTPVTTLKLTRLIFTPSSIERGIEDVRRMTTIQEIGPTFENKMVPARFWALYDQGAFD